ncbi:DNA-deoxyinosine glycosylase [Rheinheimera metallidurans]|uniref:DNA-deoxyinosine glycosylase n=1 Tax=Rheinheimera metallidurans TaxID=2925781 RepID=UPI003002B9E9
MASTVLTGLAASSLSTAKVLVLGSMPGTVSLKQQQYYAHPRNLFWPIMANLVGFSAEASYSAKLQALNAAGVALWDVIGHCQRSGSLDSAIRDEQVNDFASFFTVQPNLQVIAFNGAKAWQSFNRHVLSKQPLPAKLILFQLPSTSPAHAAMGFPEKLAQWQQLKSFIVKN